MQLIKALSDAGILFTSEVCVDFRIFAFNSNLPEMAMWASKDFIAGNKSYL